MNEPKPTYLGPSDAARVLIVDDDYTIQHLLSLVLRNDFRVAEVGSGEEAIAFLSQASVDVVLVDKNLPGMSGLDLLRHIKKCDAEIEVIVITGYASLESALEALRLGAYDYLQKPFDDISIVKGKVTLAAEKRYLQEERKKLIDQIKTSNVELRSANEQLQTRHFETLTSMITALEARDLYTKGHSERVAKLAKRIAQKMGFGADQISYIREGALLHDLGKIGIRESILNGRGELTTEEFRHIQTHPLIGSSIIGKMESYKHLIPMIRHHHERWDGSGYPDGLVGDQAPIGARIIAVADSFDAMTSERTYRKPLSFRDALKTVLRLSGTLLDPQVVKAFIEVIEQLPKEEIAS